MTNFPIQPTHLLTKIAVWALLVLTLPLNSNAACLNEHLAGLEGRTAHPLYRYLTEDFSRKYPMVARALQGKVVDHWKRSKDPVWQTLHDSIAGCLPPAKCDLRPESNKVKMHIVVSTENGVLEVKIKNIQLITTKNLILEHGRRPEGLNLSFANLFGSAMGGVAENLARTPEIKTVRIVGDNVVNRPLGKLLESYGFRKPGATTVPGAAPGAETEPSLKSQKSAYTATMAERDVAHRPQAGQNWVLEFEVKKEATK